VRALALMVLAGCGRFGFDTTVERDAAGGRDDDGAPPCFVETFDSFDTTRWRETNPDASVSVGVSNGRLQMTPTPMVDEYNGVATVDKIDFTDTRFEIEIVQALAGTGVETAIEVEYTSQSRFIVTDDRGILRFIDTLTQNGSMVPYDATEHRFWSVEHVSQTSSIRFQTSRDGVQWTNDRIMSTSQTGAITLHLYVGQYQGGNPAPGAGLFDNVRIVRAGCS
jgi:hypothetical protein